MALKNRCDLVLWTKVCLALEVSRQLLDMTHQALGFALFNLCNYELAVLTRGFFYKDTILTYFDILICIF